MKRYSTGAGEGGDHASERRRHVLRHGSETTAISRDLMRAQAGRECLGQWLAVLQGPINLMAQDRQAETDRAAAPHDHEVILAIPDIKNGMAKCARP